MTKQITDVEYEELLLKIKIPRTTELPKEERLHLICIQEVLEDFAKYLFTKEFTDVYYKPVVVIVSPYLIRFSDLLHKYRTGEISVCKGTYCVKDGEKTAVILMHDVKNLRTYFHELYHHYQELKGEEYESKLHYHDRKSEQDARFMERQLNWKYGKLLRTKLELCKTNYNTDILSKLKDKINELKEEVRAKEKIGTRRW